MPPLTGVTHAFGTVAGSVLTAVYLVAMMFSVGMGMRASRPPPPPHARRPLAPTLWALLLNLVLIPCVAVLLTRSLRLSGDVAFAVLVVAACPGGRFAPHLTRIAGGDVALATSQIMLLAKLAVFTAPLTLKWLLGLHRLHVAGLSIIAQGLLLQMVPLYAGKALGRWRGELADRLERPLRAGIVVIALAALTAFLLHSGLESVALLGDRGWLAAGGVAAASLALGWLLPGCSPATTRALVAGAMSRNLALALLLAGLTFPGHRVQLAVFGVWWILVGASYAVAWIAGHMEHDVRRSISA
jgi:BASS family bile acid:Na+ symporter